MFAIDVFEIFDLISFLEAFSSISIYYPYEFGRLLGVMPYTDALYSPIRLQIKLKYSFMLTSKCIYKNNNCVSMKTFSYSKEGLYDRSFNSNHLGVSHLHLTWTFKSWKDPPTREIVIKIILMPVGPGLLFHFIQLCVFDSEICVYFKIFNSFSVEYFLNIQYVVNFMQGVWSCKII